MKKFIISSVALKGALKKLSQATVAKSVIPALTNLYCKVFERSVQLITTDLELCIIVEIACESKDIFEVLLPFDFVNKVAGLAKDQPLTISTDGKSATIVGDSESYELQSLDEVAGFPNIPNISQKAALVIGDEFIKWLGAAQSTCSSDDLRPAMTRVCLTIADGKIEMASTDAHSLFTYTFPVESKGESPKDRQLLLSPKVARALADLSAADMYWDESHVAFKSDGTEIIARLYDESYPDYKVVFPSGEADLLKVSRPALIEALKRACLNSDGTKTTLIKLNAGDGTIHFEATDIDLGRKILVDIPGAYTGTMEQIHVSADKLRKMAEQVDFPEITLHLRDPKKAIVFTAEEDAGYYSLLMPLMINS